MKVSMQENVKKKVKTCTIALTKFFLIVSLIQSSTLSGYVKFALRNLAERTALRGNAKHRRVLKPNFTFFILKVKEQGILFSPFF